MGDSAGALANELASDPDGRFTNSELFRLASGLASGKLKVEGEKVLAPQILVICVCCCRLIFIRLALFRSGRGKEVATVSTSIALTLI